MTSPGGFDLGNMMGMIQQAQQRAEEMKQRMDDELRAKTVEGTTGGGMVKAVANGVGEVRSISIDPSLIDPAEKDMLEDLVAAAVNVALKKAKELQAEEQKGELGNLMGGMGLGGGGMPDLSALLGGGS